MKIAVLKLYLLFIETVKEQKVMLIALPLSGWGSWADLWDWLSS